MIIIKVDKHSKLEKALKIYKSKIIKTKQISKINSKKEFIKKSVLRRQQINKAKYIQKKFKSNDD
jgi:small subunit ribosomal protein S21